VRLYLVPAEIGQVGTTGDMEEESGTVEPGRVLIAEDNPDLRRIAVTMFRGLGYEVIDVANADEALEALASADQRFDLLFTDIMMPGGRTGIELAQEARERGLIHSVLFASGFASPMDLQEEVVRHGERLIRKPYRKSELAEAVRAVRARSHEDASTRASQ
jgi:CheY-like chemotaxis protein